jgi:hypothetical protein
MLRDDKKEGKLVSPYKPNGWLNRGSYMGTRWLHSDFKNIAYFYNYKLFRKIVEDGDLK